MVTSVARPRAEGHACWPTPRTCSSAGGPSTARSWPPCRRSRCGVPAASRRAGSEAFEDTPEIGACCHCDLRFVGMKRLLLFFCASCALALPLGGCSRGSSASDKQLDEMRDQLTRVQQDHDRMNERIGILEVKADERPEKTP